MVPVRPSRWRWVYLVARAAVATRTVVATTRTGAVTAAATTTEGATVGPLRSLQQPT